MARARPPAESAADPNRMVAKVLLNRAANCSTVAIENCHDRSLVRNRFSIWATAGRRAAMSAEFKKIVANAMAFAAQQFLPEAAQFAFHFRFWRGRFGVRFFRTPALASISAWILPLHWPQAQSIASG